MAEPFEARSEKSLSRFAALGGGGRKRAFLAELEAELARAERVTLVDPSRVEALARDKGIDLGSDVATPRRRLYRRFLEHCLDDHALSEEESEDLQHLQKLLSLDTSDVRTIHDDVTRAVYGQAMESVLDDCRLDPDEEAFLKRLQQEIGISEEAAAEVRREHTEQARHRFVNQSVVHGSPFVASRATEIEIEGSSESSFQDAVEAAVDTAELPIGKIEFAELKALRVDVGDQGIRKWSVTLTTRL